MSMSEQTTPTDVARNRRAAHPVPQDYGSVTPYIIVKGADAFLEFVQKAFGAVDRGRIHTEAGAIAHAEVQIGDSVLMVFDSSEHWPRTPAFLTLYVEDCDAVHQRALDAGGRSIGGGVTTNAWGDRGSRVTDPFGNIWWIQTRVEDVSEEQMVRRMGQREYIEDMQRSAAALDRQMRSIR